MNEDERAIVEYLKTQGKNFVTANEICRRAGNIKRYRDERDWAKPVLMRMADQGILETNAFGQYRLKPPEADL